MIHKHSNQENQIQQPKSIYQPNKAPIHCTKNMKIRNQKINTNNSFNYQIEFTKIKYWWKYSTSHLNKLKNIKQSITPEKTNIPLKNHINTHKLNFLPKKIN